MPQPLVIPFNRLLITLSLLVWLSIPLFILYQAFNASSLWVMIFCVLCFMFMVGTSFRYVFDVLETYRQESLLVIDEQGVISVAQYNVRATGHVAKLRRDLGIDPK